MSDRHYQTGGQDGEQGGSKSEQSLVPFPSETQDRGKKGKGRLPEEAAY